MVHLINSVETTSNGVSLPSPPLPEQDGCHTMDLLYVQLDWEVILCGHSVSMLPGSSHNNQQLSIWLLENMWQNMCEKYVACHALCCPSQYHNFGFNTNLRRHFFLILLLFQGATNLCNNPWDLKWFEILPWITWWRWKYCHPNRCTVVAD